MSSSEKFYFLQNTTNKKPAVVQPVTFIYLFGILPLHFSNHSIPFSQVE
jgi:hypothetical protein